MYGTAGREFLKNARIPNDWGYAPPAAFHATIGRRLTL